jgi:fructose-1,6-bisphosphatase/inositol monophosphatase family enzyme
MSATSPQIHALTNILRKSVKHLSRDFGEIIYLQSSAKGTYDFALRSQKRVNEILFDELSTNPKNYRYFNYNEVPENCDDEYVFIVYPLDGINNFSHALPFFSVGVSLDRKVESGYKSVAAVIEVPALEETYIVEKGKGAWVENYSRFARGNIRMRVSNRKLAKECLIFSNLNNAKYTNMASPLLELISVANGKADAAIIKTKYYNQFNMARLFVEEAGGYFKRKKELIITCNESLQSELERV